MSTFNIIIKEFGYVRKYKTYVRKYKTDENKWKTQASKLFISYIPIVSGLLFWDNLIYYTNKVRTANKVNVKDRVIQFRLITATAGLGILLLIPDIIVTIGKLIAHYLPQVLGSKKSKEGAYYPPEDDCTSPLPSLVTYYA